VDVVLKLAVGAWVKQNSRHAKKPERRFWRLDLCFKGCIRYFGLAKIMFTPPSPPGSTLAAELCVAEQCNAPPNNVLPNNVLPNNVLPNNVLPQTDFETDFQTDFQTDFPRTRCRTTHGQNPNTTPHGTHRGMRTRARDAPTARERRAHTTDSHQETSGPSRGTSRSPRPTSLPAATGTK